MTDQEEILEGWDQIGRLFNVSGRTMRKRKGELKKAKVIFKKYITIDNKPPPRPHWCAYPSKLKKYFEEKGRL